MGGVGNTHEESTAMTMREGKEGISGKWTEYRRCISTMKTWSRKAFARNIGQHLGADPRYTCSCKQVEHSAVNRIHPLVLGEGINRAELLGIRCRMLLENEQCCNTTTQNRTLPGWVKANLDDTLVVDWEAPHLMSLHWSPNPLYPRMWLCLETGALERWWMRPLGWALIQED